MTYYPDTDLWMEYEAEEDERRDRAAAVDAEMASMAAYGNAMAAARKAGRCPHGSAQGYSGGPRSTAQVGLNRGQLRCTDGCGAVFGSDEEWYAAMDAAAYPDEA